MSNEHVAELYRFTIKGEVQRIFLKEVDPSEADGIFRMYPPVVEPRSGTVEPANNPAREVSVSEIASGDPFHCMPEMAKGLTCVYNARFTPTGTNV